MLLVEDNKVVYVVLSKDKIGTGKVYFEQFYKTNSEIVSLYFSHRPLNLKIALKMTLQILLNL